MTKHGEMKLKCPHCDYSSKRKDNLTRHVRIEHNNVKMVKSLLNDVVETAMMEKVSVQDESELEDQDAKVSPYLQARNERVAEIQAEFRRRYPEFGQEVRDLGISRKRRAPRKKSIPALCVRKSSRTVALQKPMEIQSVLEIADEGEGAAGLGGDDGDSLSGDIDGEVSVGLGHDAGDTPLAAVFLVGDIIGEGEGVVGYGDEAPDPVQQLSVPVVRLRGRFAPLF